MDRGEIIASLRVALAAEQNIVAAWLFGSVARSSDHGGSDVDVAILTRRAATGTLDDLWLDLRGSLTAALGREVDLVVLDHADGELTHRVLRDGVVLRETDRAARVRFEVGARNRWFDMQPILQAYRRGRAA